MKKNLKRLAMITLLLVIAAAFTACGGVDSKAESDTESSGGSTEIVVLEKKETEKDSLDNLQDFVKYIETGMVDENGCAKDDEAFGALVDRFYEEAKTACDNGAYLDIAKGDEYVALLLDSGLVFVYSPYKEGFLSGSGTYSDFSMTLFNPLDSEKETGAPQLAVSSKYYDHFKGLEAAASDSAYDISFTHYRNFECDLDAYKQLLTEGKRIIYLGGHGWFVPEEDGGPATLILSGIRYDEADKDSYNEMGMLASEEARGIDWTSRNGLDWLIGGLIDDSYHEANIVVNQNLCIYLGPKFFRNLSARDYLKDSVVFLGACSSAKLSADNILVNTLLGKGADVVTGYSENVKFIYDSALSDDFLQGLVNKDNSSKTFEELLKHAQKFAEEKIDIGNYKNDKDFGTDHSNDYMEFDEKEEKEVEVNCEALIFGEYKDKTVEEWLNIGAEADDGRIVLSGTIDVYSYAEMLKLQGKADPNAGYTDTTKTYHLVVLDSPQTLSLVSGDGVGHSEHEAKMILLGDSVTNDYDGKHIEFSIDPEASWWPSDTRLPVGEPSTDDIVIIGETAGTNAGSGSGSKDSTEEDSEASTVESAEENNKTVSGPIGTALESGPTFEYDGKEFVFDKERHFDRLTYKSSDEFTDHNYSTVLDVKNNHAYNSMVYKVKKRQYFGIGISLLDVVRNDSWETVDINGTRWFYSTVDGRNQDMYRYYYPDAKNGCTYWIEIIAFYDKLTLSELESLANTFMSTVTLE